MYAHDEKKESDLTIAFGKPGDLNKIEKFKILSKILIIENDDNISVLFKDIINNLKFKYNVIDDLIIDCCNDCNIICQMIDLIEYDIIFMDLNICDINGISLVKLLRNKYFNKKIIGTTTDIEHKNKKNKIIDLFDDIILKPFDENIILRNLKY